MIDLVLTELFLYSLNMQIALQNTYTTCNYVNCLCLFIQLFILLFAHAFICHIRGWQWCSERCTLALQAPWTDNGHREKIPLSGAELQADLCTVHITIWRGVAKASHTSTQQEARNTRACTFSWNSHSVLGLVAQIISGCVHKMRLYIINVIKKPLLIIKKSFTFWQAKFDYSIHKEHWCGKWMMKRRLSSK